jgi:hypothetical protein
MMGDVKALKARKIAALLLALKARKIAAQGFSPGKSGDERVLLPALKARKIAALLPALKARKIAALLPALKARKIAAQGFSPGVGRAPAPLSSRPERAKLLSFSPMCRPFRAGKDFFSALRDPGLKPWAAISRAYSAIAPRPQSDPPGQFPACAFSAIAPFPAASRFPGLKPWAAIWRAFSARDTFLRTTSARSG